jgi:hypothetical protein
MNPLGAAAEAANVALLVVRHFNKDTSASPLQRGAGSLGGIVGAARALWTVTLDPEDDTGETKAVGVTKLNYAKSPPALRYRVVERVPPGWLTGSVSGIEWLGASPVSISVLMTDTAAAGDARDALEGILADGPVAHPRVESLMRSNGFGRDATNRASKRLAVEKSKTGFRGGWEWSLPKEPEEAGPLAGAPASSGGPEGTEDTEEAGAASSPASSPLAGARVQEATFVPASSVSSASSGAEGTEGAEEAGPAGGFTRVCAREGRCPECNRVVEIDTVGRLRPHYADSDLADAKWGADPCPGSAGLPAPEEIA